MSDFFVNYKWGVFSFNPVKIIKLFKFMLTEVEVLQIWGCNFLHGQRKIHCELGHAVACAWSWRDREPGGDRREASTVKVEMVVPAGDNCLELTPSRELSTSIANTNTSTSTCKLATEASDFIHYHSIIMLNVCDMHI